jgi:hypothetical protein
MAARCRTHDGPGKHWLDSPPLQDLMSSPTSYPSAWRRARPCQRSIVRTRGTEADEEAQNGREHRPWASGRKATRPRPRAKVGVLRWCASAALTGFPETSDRSANGETGDRIGTKGVTRSALTSLLTDACHGASGAAYATAIACMVRIVKAQRRCHGGASIRSDHALDHIQHCVGIDAKTPHAV